MPSHPSPAGPHGRPIRLFALVPCAGVGSRAGTELPKQYRVLAGRAVVGHALRALAEVGRLSATLVVLNADDRWFESACADYSGWVARCGGATRALSVLQGLDDLARRGAQPNDWVLVHDAARCLIRPAWVNRLIDRCIDDPVGGLLAMPVADTLKLEVQGRVKHTVARDGTWAAQTPQMFRLGLLREALLNAGPSVTDEASAVESAGHAPRLVPGSAENIKLTWPEDFDIAARLLGSAPRDHQQTDSAAPEMER